MDARGPSLFAFDEFELDAERLELRRTGKLIKADQVVLRLLARLVRSPGQLVTKDELVEDVWEGRAVADTAITVSMARLRKALDDRRGEREIVVTVHGRGYRFARPVSVRAAPATGATPAFEPQADREPPFVGRERVLARMRHALDEARAGRGRLQALLGESGIGKTRAVEAFERELISTNAHDVRVVWGFCREAGDTPPLWPWLRLRRELSALVKDGAGEPELGADGALRHEVFAALLTSMQQHARDQALVLVLDDVHRADAASLELLRYALDEIAHTRILLIATVRHGRGQPAPRPETELPNALGHRNCERITLERLSGDDVARYVGALLDDPDGRCGRAVFAKSEGNPFFMTELARELQQAERPEPDSLTVPDAALALVRQRIDKLDAGTREVLHAAAVIGRSFELPLLQTATEREPSALMASLYEAIAAEVVIAAADSRSAFAFGHELLRAALYDAMPPRARRQGHARVGAALEQRASLGDIAPPSELAYHFVAALPDCDPRKTVQYCRAAAAASAPVFANVDVVRYMRQAIEALDLLERPSVRLRMTLLATIIIYGRSFAVADARSAMDELLRLAREHGDGVMLLRGAIMLNPRPGSAPQPGAYAALSAALTLLGDDQPGLRAIALSCLACAAPPCFERERSDALLAESFPLARATKLPTALQSCYRAQLYLQGGPALEPLGTQARDELELLAQQHPRLMPVLPADLALERAVWSLQRGDDPAVLAALERCKSACRELGPGEVLWNSERYAALRLINLGASSEGLAALSALHRQAEQRGFFGTAPLCAFDRAVLFRGASESAPIDDALRNGLELDGGEPPGIWSLKLRALCALGLLDEARAMLRAVPADRLAQLPCDSEYLGTLGHLARSALALDARDHMAALLALLEPYPQLYSAHVSFLCEGAMPQLLGMLAHALGRREQALAALETGLAMNESAGFLPRASETRLWLARALLARGSAADAQRASALAREAGDGAARFGMQRMAREAAALAAETTKQ